MIEEACESQVEANAWMVAALHSMALEIDRLQKRNSFLEKEREARIRIEKAKGLLMEDKGLTEKDAYRLMRSTSMKQHKPLSELAEAILIAFDRKRAEKLGVFSLTIS